MTADRSILSIRAALRAGDAADARRAFLALPGVAADFADLLAVVLRDAYADASVSVTTDIAFLAALDNVQWALAGCGVLHGIHSEQQARAPFADVPVFRFARFVEDLLEQIPADDALRPRAEMLAKQWFGPNVRAVVRGEAVKIESRLRREILYAAASDLMFDAARRFVFTWSSAWYHDGNRSEHFIAEPVDDSWTRFALRSAPYGEYLVAELVDDADDPLRATRPRVFAGRGRTRDEVGTAGIWTLKLQDGARYRDVFRVRNALTNQYLQSPGGFHYDTSRRFVTTAPAEAEDDDEVAQTMRWLVSPLAPQTPLEEAIEAFYQGRYTDADDCFRALAVPSADLDARVRRDVFRLICRLRRSEALSNETEIEFESLEVLRSAAIVERLGLQGLWGELVTAIYGQRRRDAASNPQAHADREMRRASRLVATGEYASALAIYADAALIAQPSEEIPGDALRKLRARARLERAKVLFAMERCGDALTELEDLRSDATLPNELAARALLWTAKCQRQTQCDWASNLTLLRRALDKLAASDTVADGLRHSIVLEMIVANVAHNGPQTNAKALSAEKVMELCRCPISLEVMADPVVAPSGVSYEREMIELHLCMNGAFDPMTHAALTREQLYPNRMLRQMVELVMAAYGPATERDDAPAQAW